MKMEEGWEEGRGGERKKKNPAARTKVSAWKRLLKKKHNGKVTFRRRTQ